MQQTYKISFRPRYPGGNAASLQMIHRGKTDVHNEHVAVLVVSSSREQGRFTLAYTLVWPGRGGSQEGIAINVPFLNFANLVVTPTPSQLKVHSDVGIG